MANIKGKKEKISVDHNSSIPFFIQIAETMKRRILSGQYNPGKQLFTGEELEKAKGVKIHKVNQTIRSVAADLDISSALKIPFGAPLFFNESTYLSISGKAIFLSQMNFRGDMFVFKTSSPSPF